MMRKNIYRVSVLLTVLVLLVTYTVSYALSQRTNFKAVPSEVTEWTTYTDPRFDFSVSIPATWILSPREDRPGTIGERLVISAPVSDTNQGELGSTKIEIGLYLVERELEQPLLNWSELYDANHDEFDASRILVLATEKRTQQNQDAYYKAAISPLTAYTYVNIPYGNVVWGIWMNSINEEYQNVLKHIADSISFGKNAPKTLTQAYGDNFEPQPLVPQNSQGKDINGFLGNSGSFSVTVNNYTVPVNESVSLKCGSANAPVCGGTHSGSAGEAIDIGVTYKMVYAAATSFYDGSQWSNTGYGNLIKLRDYQNNVAWYAHLNWFTNPNNYFFQGQLVGQSGSSGTNSPHLHFHVQNGSTPVDLSGMVGLYLNSNYPNCNKETCEEIEELNNEECTCGQVN